MDNNTLLTCLFVGIGLLVVFYLIYNNKEKFRAPRRFLRYGNYHFHDHGLGSHLYQTDWTRGAFFQPFVPLDQGLYTSNEWSPRYIRHDNRNPTSCNR